LAVEQGILTAEKLVLVGQPEALSPLVEQHGLQGAEILPAEEVVGMDESAASAVRTKRKSSIALGMARTAQESGAAFVSAGNTGAVVAAASLVLGRLDGVARPGIAVPMPARSGPCVVIDVGANIYCKPAHMLQYAVMASEYCRAVLGIEEPRVGLLNIGEEDGKGNPLIQETHGLLLEAGMKYVGFVEGNELTEGRVDVVVCEGFVGNVILKVSEGLASYVSQIVLKTFVEHPPRDEVKQSVGEAFTKLDYAEYGGAPLLGAKSPVLIGHGRSGPHAIMNMIRAATAAVDHDVNKLIVERLGALTGGSVS